MKHEKPFDQSRFNRLVESQLLLFVSVDLENSTQFKQALAGQQQQDWLKVVVDFVDTFPEIFERHVGKTARERQLSPAPSPALWKILGDELVFRIEVKRDTHATVHLEALKASLAEWNADVRQQRRTSPEHRTSERRLLAKGAAWLAGFPVTNAILPIAGNHDDYLGPSMDAGFRLGKLSSPRRLALSVDLVWLLLTAGCALTFEFEGRTPDLKGVAAESGYPHLWTEVEPSAYLGFEATLTGQLRTPHPPEKLRELCEKFIAEFGVPAHPPFIPGQSAHYPPPPGYEADRKHVIAQLGLLYKMTGQDPAPSDAKAAEAATSPASLLANLSSTPPAPPAAPTTPASR
jgi:hypothetical protein